jgi:hypothetical protein
MGYGVAMTKTCSTHVTPEERATLSLGLTQGHLLRVIARVWATRPAPQAASWPAIPHGASRSEPVRRKAQSPQSPRLRKLLDPWLWQ